MALNLGDLRVGPGGRPPPIFRTNWGPKGPKKIFWRPAPHPPPPYLRVWMTGPHPPYLELWDRHSVAVRLKWFESYSWSPTSVKYSNARDKIAHAYYTFSS